MLVKERLEPSLYSPSGMRRERIRLPRLVGGNEADMHEVSHLFCGYPIQDPVARLLRMLSLRSILHCK
jgi:hypothetical protein